MLTLPFPPRSLHPFHSGISAYPFPFPLPVPPTKPSRAMQPVNAWKKKQKQVTIKGLLGIIKTGNRKRKKKDSNAYERGTTGIWRTESGPVNNQRIKKSRKKKHRAKRKTKPQRVGTLKRVGVGERVFPLRKNANRKRCERLVGGIAEVVRPGCLCPRYPLIRRPCSPRRVSSRVVRGGVA